MQDEAAHMMSPSNVRQPFIVASVCVEVNKTFIAYVDAINRAYGISEGAVFSLAFSVASCWPVDRSVWSVLQAEAHERRYSKFWLLDLAVTCCREGEGALQRIRHDPVREPHLLAPAKRILPRGGFLHPVASLFSIFTFSLTLASLKSKLQQTKLLTGTFMYTVYMCTYKIFKSLHFCSTRLETCRI